MSDWLDGGWRSVRIPHLKVCGITRVEDALAAADLGARAIGFVFWPQSPRAVTVRTARAIVRELPPFVATVGVFVNQPRTQILDIAGAVPLTAVQFHGDEDDEDVAAFPWRVLRAVSLEAAGSDERIARLPEHVTVLLDAHDPHRRGGTGMTTDWQRAAAVAEARPVVLAGGLQPSNIAEAVRVVRPWGVDVSSGVEASPGVKDLEKLAAFVSALEGALDLDPFNGPARGDEMSGARL